MLASLGQAVHQESEISSWSLISLLPLADLEAERCHLLQRKCSLKPRYPGKEENQEANPSC